MKIKRIQMLNYPMISRKRLSIVLLILTIITLFIIITKLELLSTVVLVYQYTFQQDERSNMLNNMDILAHPEKYPIDIFEEESQDKTKNSSPSRTSTDTWRNVTKRLYTYSAFVDPRTRENRTAIRIIALIHVQDQEDLNLRCLFRFNKSLQNLTGEHSASMILQEQHDSTYLGAFFFCFFKGSGQPTQVALHDEDTDEDLKWLDVHGTQQHVTKDTIGICVRPIYGHGIDGNLLAEFMAYYYGTGVKRFTFYDYQTPEKVSSYLKLLEKVDDLDINLLNWKLPDVVANGTWQYGQVISIQDCILRNTNEKYVLLVDVDEFLIPRQHSSILELMEDIDAKSKRQIGSYIFRQSFFCKAQNPPKSAFPLEISEKMTRESKIWPSKKRSKVIVKPRKVIEVGIHFVWHHLKGWKSAKVPWELAMVHHYSKRDCEKNITLVEDRAAEPFMIETILAKPFSIWKTFSNG